MEENVVQERTKAQPDTGQKPVLNFQVLFSTLLLNWYWYLLSLIICLGIAFIYLRYSTPIYMSNAKMLIKEESGRAANNMRYTSTLGTISNSTGMSNEMEILKSKSIAIQTVRDLKLYTTYRTDGRIKDLLLYKNQPVTVDIDPKGLEKIKVPIRLVLEKKDKGYHVSGNYYVTIDDERVEGPFSIDKDITLPASITTRAGVLTFAKNNSFELSSGDKILISIESPEMASGKWKGGLNVTNQEGTSLAILSIADENPQRAIDYLKQLAVSYNNQANEDKNEVALRTELFINSRLEKINTELGSTEGQIENFKRSHRMVELSMNASNAVQNSNKFEQDLVNANTQLALFNSITEYMNDPSNKYQTLPSNVGLSDGTATELIGKYNEIVLQRNRLLKSASENSPAVTPLTAQLDDLTASIKRAMSQAKRAFEIQRNAILGQYNKFTDVVMQTPEQERMLTQIGRQQEVKSGLYLMLLQKREENSISLASTADKGKLIDQPAFAGKVSPVNSNIYAAAILIALLIPSLILFLINFFRNKIEGHEDVAALTNLPIIADVAMASETAKTKADIVVHENQNNQMEEIFRAMRTNIQFMLKENQKVISFTSSVSGEGKTFNAANLSVSFALLGKKVILVGLDIRKPRLAELFGINDHRHGITPLLPKEDPTMEEVKSQILDSGINGNLDLLMSGPIPPNPAELLSRNSLDKVFEVLKDLYDYIIVDTAPVGLVTDTLQLGRITDVTVVMCRADYTPREHFLYINALSDENKLPNMCIIINGIDMSKKKYGYAYGYGKYGKYGRYGRYGRYGKYTSGKNSTHNMSGYMGYGSYKDSNYGNKNDTSIKQ